MSSSPASLERPRRGSRARRLVSRITTTALAAALSLTAARPAAADARLFRPLTADPRENQTRWRMSRYTEDWRYGTDVSDSTSRGGVVEDREGVSWEIDAGEVFRWKPLERIGTWRGPWVAYQVGVPAGLFSRFDGTSILLNADYQFGASFDVLWRGRLDKDRGVIDYMHGAVTSRLTVMHHSSHLGDEYIAQGAFGRNQISPPYQGAQLGRPPVKRVDLTYEDVAFTLSLERSGADPKATLRAYVGGDMKLALPSSWGIGGLTPRNFDSPAARGGLEYRSSGQSDAATGELPAQWLNRLVRSPMFDSEWFAAIDLRLAKPYNFASADNATGESEAWTPRLWTAAPYGREFRNYASSWHAMVGTSIQRRSESRGGIARRIGPEWIVALEWYRGYARDGQFLDQRSRYKPRGWVMPSVTAHF